MQLAMDFCSNLFAPTDPEMYKSVGKRIEPSKLQPDGPILLPKDVQLVVGPFDTEAMHVLNEINARKPIHNMYNVADNFGEESFNGFAFVCERGKLGLSRIGKTSSG